jgi:formate-dependent nitrite reductase cytochrome c552 subunit
MYQVELTRADGTKKLFEVRDMPEEPGEWRTMDCVDCHNRPSHVYRLPDNEIDDSIDSGRIDQTLPFVKREGMRLIRNEYSSHEEAKEVIARELKAFYAESYPDIVAERGEDIDNAATELGLIYSYNVFPQMKVEWGTYPDHSGHDETPGCFRCHNRQLKTADGDRISRKCSLCHTVLANKEQDPEILTSIE